MYSNRKVLDHGKDFKHPKLHNLLEYILRIKESAGDDSPDYEQAVVKLAGVLSAISDWNPDTWPPHELYHYFEGHHKEDVQRAVNFIDRCSKMQPNAPEGDMEYENSVNSEFYNNKYIARDTINHMDMMSLPNMANGWTRTEDLQGGFMGSPINYKYTEWYGTVNDRNPDAFEDVRPWTHEDKERFYNKLTQNEYFRMIIGRNRDDR